MIVYIAFFTNSENWLPWGISYYKEIPDLYNEETKLIKNIISKGLLGINNETLGSNWLWWPDQKWSIK
jgi:hypothetical protein